MRLRRAGDKIADIGDRTVNIRAADRLHTKQNLYGIGELFGEINKCDVEDDKFCGDRRDRRHHQRRKPRSPSFPRAKPADASRIHQRVARGVDQVRRALFPRHQHGHAGFGFGRQCRQISGFRFKVDADGPAGFDIRDFLLRYDAVIHQIPNHFALVRIAQDFRGGLVGDEQGVELGIIRYDFATASVPPLEVKVGQGSLWIGERAFGLRLAGFLLA
jgi:hypothetical protein